MSIVESLSEKPCKFKEICSAQPFVQPVGRPFWFQKVPLNIRVGLSGEGYSAGN